MKPCVEIRLAYKPQSLPNPSTGWADFGGVHMPIKVCILGSKQTLGCKTMDFGVLEKMACSGRTPKSAHFQFLQQKTTQNSATPMHGFGILCAVFYCKKLSQHLPPVTAMGSLPCCQCTPRPMKKEERESLNCSFAKERVRTMSQVQFPLHLFLLTVCGNKQFAT